MTLTNAAGCCAIHLAASYNLTQKSHALTDDAAVDPTHLLDNAGGTPATASAPTTPSTAAATAASPALSRVTPHINPNPNPNPNGSGRVVALLLRHGCPGSVRDGNKQTVLHHAARSGNNGAAVVLLQWAVSQPQRLLCALMHDLTSTHLLTRQRTKGYWRTFLKRETGCSVRTHQQTRYQASSI